jgi:UDP-glucuronate 4-epimerase
MGHTYNHLFNLDCTFLRLFTVYGPRQRPEMAIHLFTRKIVNGEQIPMFGDGSTSRDYTYIDDIVDGLQAAAKYCDGYSVYNLGNDSPIKLWDLIHTIGKAVGKEPNIDQQPIPPGDVLQTWANISKARTELNYSPSWSIEDGIKSFVEWFKEAHSRS